MDKITRHDIKESVATGITNLLLDMHFAGRTLWNMYGNAIEPIAMPIAEKLVQTSTEIGQKVKVTR